MSLKFTTREKGGPVSVIDGAEPITFTVDGEEFTAYPPTPAQYAYHVREQASGDPSRQIAGIINFLDMLLDEQGRKRFEERLLDRDDDFDLDEVSEVIQGLVEEWSSRPTSKASGSSSSPNGGGRTSTGKRRSAG